MKIEIVPYNPGWTIDFEALKKELADATWSLAPQIEHIGSTAVKGLAAKPIIDILIGVMHTNDLDQIPQALMARRYIYYEKYNQAMPYRRFFVKLHTNPSALSLPIRIGEADAIPAGLNNHHHRRAHIHVLPFQSEHWIRHVAFRNYLRTHPDVKTAYQQLKEKPGILDWADGNVYNEAKDAFLKTAERNAVIWYHRHHAAL